MAGGGSARRAAVTEAPRIGGEAAVGIERGAPVERDRNADRRLGIRHAELRLGRLVRCGGRLQGQPSRPVLVGASHGDRVGQQPTPQRRAAQRRLLRQEEGGGGGGVRSCGRRPRERGVRGGPRRHVVGGAQVRLGQAGVRRPARAVGLHRACGVVGMIDRPHGHDVPEVGRSENRAGGNGGGNLLVEAEQLELPRAPRAAKADPVGSGTGRGDPHRFGRLLGPRLVLRRRGGELVVRIVQVQIVVRRRLWPIVPGEIQDDLRAARGVQGDRLVVPLVAVPVGEHPLVVALGLVAGSVDPQDAAVDRALGDLGDRPGAIVEVGVVPAERVVDDVDASIEAVRHGLVELHLVGDLDQVELGLGGDIVDDLGDGRAVGDPRGQPGAGEIVLDHRAGQIAPCLRLAQSGEAHVDDRDLGPAAANPGAVVRIGADGCRALGRRPQRVRGVGRADEPDPAELGRQGP